MLELQLLVTELQLLVTELQLLVTELPQVTAELQLVTELQLLVVIAQETLFPLLVVIAPHPLPSHYAILRRSSHYNLCKRSAFQGCQGPQ